MTKNQIRLLFILTTLTLAIASLAIGMRIGVRQRGTLKGLAKQSEWRVRCPPGMPNKSFKEVDKSIKPDDFTSIDFNLRDGTVVSLVRTNL